MIKLRALLAVFAVLSVSAAFPSAASACDDWQNPLWGARAFGYSGTMYGLGFVPVPPYFALHPPVYYGERFFRSYGESPFARPPFSSRPQRIQAQLVVNPFARDVLLPPSPVSNPAATESAAPIEEVTAKVEMIINPFYRANDEVVQK